MIKSLNYERGFMFHEAAIVFEITPQRNINLNGENADMAEAYFGSFPPLDVVLSHGIEFE